MIEQLQDIEKARQEMKRKAFEEAFQDELGAQFWQFDLDDDGNYEDRETLCGWHMWQAAQEQMLHGRWISVIDQLPPSGEMVLICWADNPEIEPEKDFMDVCVDTANKYWSNFGDDQPTHWQPLPQPPKQ